MGGDMVMDEKIKKKIIKKFKQRGFNDKQITNIINRRLSLQVYKFMLWNIPAYAVISEYKL